jgi:hypothetical protein
MTNRLTVFFSWQADAPNSLNRNFIEQALHEAVKRLHLDAVIENARREIPKEPAKTVPGIGGLPSVAEAIFRKIDECAIFVADLSFVGLPKGALTNVTSRPRHFPNPNVLIEYGYALRALSHEKLIGIVNTAWGRPDATNLSFDLPHLCWPIMYHLSSPSASDKKGQLENLIQTMVKALEAMLPEHAPQLV